MKILKLKIENLNSLRGPITIDFQKPPLNLGGLFAITGDTGAGKTTILDTLTLALYGRIPRNKDAKEVLSYQTTDCLAEVEFEHSGQLLRAKWSLWRAHGKTDGNLLGPKRELARYNPETEAFDIIAESIREVNEQIEELTGLDYDRFRRSVLLAQGDFAAFLDAGERERSELLERITGTEVYSELSMAAFERNKKEVQALAEIEQQLKNLDILLPEIREELEKELRVLGQTIKEIRRIKDKLEKQTHAHRERKQVREKIESLEKQRQELEQNFVELKPRLDRLKRFEQISPLSKDLEWLLEKEEHLAALPQRQKTLQEQLEKQTDQIDQKLTRIQQLQEQRKERQQLLNEQRPKWNRTRILDTALNNLKHQLEALQKQLNEQRARLAETVKKEQEDRQKVKAQEKERAHLQKWLEENQHLAGLASQGPLLNEKINQFQLEATDRQAIEKKRKALQKEAKTTREKWKEKSGQQQKINDQLAKLEEKFIRLSPAELPHDREGLIRQIEYQIKQQEKSQETQDQLLELISTYERTLKDKQGAEGRMQKLFKKEDQLNTKILNLLDLLYELEQESDYKAELFRQQQLIANYEKDRHQLDAGDPCPLCGSTDHPFRQHKVKPYTDRARQEYEGARDRLEEQKEIYSRLLKEQAKIAEQLRDLQNQDQVFQLNLQQSENAIAKLLKNLGRADLSAGLSLNTFRRQLLKGRQQLDQKVAQREQLDKLHQELNAHEKEARELATAIAHLKVQLEYQQEKIHETEKLEKDKDKLLAQWDTELRQKWQEFGLTFVQEHTTHILEKAKQLELDFKQKNQAFTEITQKIQHAEQALTTSSQLQEHRRMNIAQKEEELTKQKQYREQLQAERSGLLGDQDPDRAEEAFQKMSEEIQSDLEAEQAASSHLEKQVHFLRAKVKELDQQQLELKTAIAKRKTQLETAARKRGMDSLQELRAAVIPEAEARQIREDQSQWEKKKAELDGLLKENKEQLKKWESEIADSTDLRKLENQLAELDGEFRGALKKEGALGEKLSADDEKVATQQVLLEAQQEQKRRCSRWGQLNDLIGSADGKKFRTFAQGLTLERLIRFANRHLEHLNGRYEIFKLPEQDLEFVIIDTFQANNQRSVYTLSGGEKFLVSLALALGLSDLAGKRSQIRSLFIDEGFGTLDENSLDLAISTLENLQATGKSIGIISHVPALKERIGTRIQVEKQSDGFSRIRLIG